MHIPFILLAFAAVGAFALLLVALGALAFGGARRLKDLGDGSRTRGCLTGCGGAGAGLLGVLCLAGLALLWIATLATVLTVALQGDDPDAHPAGHHGETDHDQHGGYRLERRLPGEGYELRRIGQPRDDR